VRGAPAVVHGSAGGKSGGIGAHDQSGGRSLPLRGRCVMLTMCVGLLHGKLYTPKEPDEGALCWSGARLHCEEHNEHIKKKS